MTHHADDVFVICEEPPSQCELCGRCDELRPYGPGAKFVCFKCAMKDEDNAKAMFLKRIRGDG
jgi:hypothetical protein